jgi:uncharacterized protein (TIGR00661 family)
VQISKNILVAPLNWGLGHATRCIPIINAIIENGDNPIIASDGEALLLLKKEFANLRFIELPSYNINYSRPGASLKWKMVKDMPKVLKAVIQEHRTLKKLIKTEIIHGVIADNRMGLFNVSIPCVYVTHQLRVLSGNTTWLSTLLHQLFIKRFKTCWIPDVTADQNLSGILSKVAISGIKQVYMGPLSRFQNTGSYQKKYDLLVLLSGPEPQRGILEKKLLSELQNYKGEVLFVAGKLASEQIVVKKGDLTYYNYLSTDGLQKALDRSAVVLSRSGYTSIMDLCKLGKKAFFIPTPGQHEQEYLAHKLQKDGIVPFATQDAFTINMLERVAQYTGFEAYSSTITSMSSIGLLLEEAFSSVKENSEPIPGSLSM